MLSYKTKGVCSQEIRFELDGDTIKQVTFIGGCSGNTQGVSRLVEGMKVQDAIADLRVFSAVPADFLSGPACKSTETGS